MLLETFKTTKLRYLLTLFSLLCLLVSPHDAYAADQGYGSFWYGPNEKTVEGVKYLKTGVVASNKYDGALYALGFSKSTVNGISNTKKNKLIKDSTFSSFANGFKTGKPDDDAIGLIPGIPTVGLYSDSMLTTWYASSAVYGESSCYWSVYSNDAANSAKSAASTIIKSGSESGGGSSGSGGGNAGTADSYVYFDVATDNVANKDDIKYAGLAINLEYYNGMLSYLNSHSDYGLWIAIGRFAGGSTKYYTICLVDKKPNYMPDDEGHWSIYFWTDGDTNIGFVQSDAGSIEYGGKEYLKMASNIVFNPNKVGHGNKEMDACRPVLGYYWSGSDGIEPEGPSEPPTDWPVEPPAPEPPKPPEPIEPDPPTPWEPIPDIDIDITGEDFQDLLDALNEHCIHLQNSISSNISQLWQLQSDLFSDHMNTFWDNLHNDLLWLGECLNFDVNVNVDGGTSGGDDGGEGDTDTYVPFDDSSVIYWLKQIWSKLGNGISTRPVDPVVNPNGWWDWFSGLLAGLIGSLADIGLDKIGGLVDALDTLKDKFPFCIPWDIAALLGLLVSEPVTPVIEVPLMALGVSDGVQQVGTMVIDLEPYDDAWEAVRWIERIAFCVYLATRTKDFLDLLGKIKG